VDIGIRGGNHDASRDSAKLIEDLLKQTKKMQKRIMDLESLFMLAKLI